jgi:hypothetical protein
MDNSITTRKPVAYPTAPDTTIKVGDRVRSFDFPGEADCYFVGMVESITVHKQYKIKVEYQVWEGKRVPDNQNYCAYVCPPLNGLEGFAGPIVSVQRITEGEE